MHQQQYLVQPANAQENLNIQPSKKIRKTESDGSLAPPLARQGRLLDNGGGGGGQGYTSVGREAEISELHTTSIAIEALDMGHLLHSEVQPLPPIRISVWVKVVGAKESNLHQGAGKFRKEFCACRGVGNRDWDVLCFGVAGISCPLNECLESVPQITQKELRGITPKYTSTMPYPGERLKVSAQKSGLH